MKDACKTKTKEAREVMSSLKPFQKGYKIFACLKCKRVGHSDIQI